MDFDDDDYEELASSNAKIGSDGIEIKVAKSALDTIANTVAQRLENAMARRIEKMLLAKVDEIVDAKFTEAVGSIALRATEAYLAKPRQKTNAWGEPMSGGTVTLSELIPAKVEDWLSESVNSKGDRVTDSYDKRNSVTRIAWMMSNHVRDELNVATKEAAAKVTEQAKIVVQQHVGRFIADQLVPQIDVTKRMAP